jgi:hypothetical protein
MSVHTAVDRHPLTLAARVLVACVEHPVASRAEIAHEVGSSVRAAEANIAAPFQSDQVIPQIATCQVALVNGQVQPSPTPISYQVDKHPSGNIILRLDGPNGVWVAFLPPDFARGMGDALRERSGGIIIPQGPIPT